MLTRHHHPKPDLQDGPERRYAALHRSLDQGKTSDALWTELVNVCVKIGNNDEAVQTAKLIKSPTERAVTERWLASKGLVDHPPSRPSRASGPSHPPHPTRTPGTPVRRHQDWDTLERLLQPSFKEELSGAFRFLFEDHMPLTVMVTALTFPLVVGLGGFLTQGTNELLLPVIALVPILSVIALVCALSRKIMVEAATGMDEPPAIPELGSLIQHAVRFLVDSAVMAVVFLGPAVACYYEGIPRGVTIGVLALGIILLPMALVLRQVRNDWRAFWPPTLLGAVVDGGIPYLGALIVGALLFVPAVAVGIGTLGSELYLQVSFAGPLLAMPLLVASRFTGRVLSNRSEWLKKILVDQRATCQQAHSNRQAPSSARYRRPGTRRSAITTGGVHSAAIRPGSARRAQVRRQRTKLNAPTHPEMSGTLRVRSVQGRKKPTPPPPARDETCRLFHKVYLDGDDVFVDDKPDVMNMAGSTAFKGKDRVVAGAAAKTTSGVQTEEEDR